MLQFYDGRCARMNLRRQAPKGRQIPVRRARLTERCVNIYALLADDEASWHVSNVPMGGIAGLA